MVSKKIGESLLTSLKSSPVKKRYDTCSPSREPKLIFHACPQPPNPPQKKIDQISLIPPNFNSTQKFSVFKAKSKLRLKLIQNGGFKGIKDQFRDLKSPKGNKVKLNYYRMKKGRNCGEDGNSRNIIKLYNTTLYGSGQTNRNFQSWKRIRGRNLQRKVDYRRTASLEEVSYDKILNREKALESFEKPMVKYSQHSIQGKDMSKFRYLNGYKIYNQQKKRVKIRNNKNQNLAETNKINQRHLRRLQTYFKAYKEISTDTPQTSHLNTISIPLPSESSPLHSKNLQNPSTSPKRTIFTSHKNQIPSSSPLPSSTCSSPTHLIPINIKTTPSPLPNPSIFANKYLKKNLESFNHTHTNFL